MHENIIACFEDALEFIGIEIAKVEEARINNKHVLVHCALGKSRSASIVIAYLMKYQKMTLREAYQYGKSRRPVVSPNPNYIRQLREF
jgi:protein-tyrosine phosphatase